MNCILLGANLYSIGANTIGLGSVLTDTVNGYTKDTTSIGTTNTLLTQIFGAVSTGIYTVATLPTYTGIDRTGYRAFVTNATQTMTAGIGAIVVGGGSNKVPVYFDGTNWRIG